MTLLGAFIYYPLAFILCVACAVGGVFLGKHFRAKKDAKQSVETSAK